MHFSTRMRHARAANNARITPQMNLLKTAPAIRHQKTTELGQNIIRPVPITTDSEVEDIDRYCHTAIRPHSSIQTVSIFVDRFRQHFETTLISSRDIFRQGWHHCRSHQSDGRLVTAQNLILHQQLTEIRCQRTQHIFCGNHDVQQR